ncbi:MAG TPA: PAS domain S-box protein [Roseiflexaceae bacterium]|nr:PAS domain S-box protein [Roseiflexaceae bacterium]
MTFFRRALALIRSERYLAGIAGLFFVTVVSLLALTNVSLEIQAAVRAYVHGEARWTQAQKAAVYNLTRYAFSHDERDYERYLRALAVPLADSRARQELERANPDLSVVTVGFLGGHNHPDDIPNMIRLYRTFRHVTYIERAIDIWAQADRDIAALQRLGDELRALVATGQADEARVRAILAQIDEVDIRLTAHQEAFSQTLGAGARWVKQGVFELSLLVGAALLAVGIVPSARMLRRVLDSESRYRQLVELYTDALFLHDLSGRLLDVNEQTSAMLGYTRAELLGMLMSDVDVNFDLETARAAWSQLPANTIVTFESLHRRKDGTLVPVEVRLSRIRLNDTDVVLGTARDLTERRQAEAERLALQARLLEAEKLESLAILAGGVAHDFNNLLAVIVGNAELAQLDLPPDSPAADAISAIEQAASRAADLTRQMLAYSGRGHFVVQPIQLNTLISELGPLLHASVGRQVVLHSELADDLPLVMADAAQIRQLIKNLVVNASEAIGEQPGTVTITTTLRWRTAADLAATHTAPDLPEGWYVGVTVRDTGAGMDEATLARIFDPFFTTKFVGRGLGLAAVLGIVRGHRGAIEVASRVGAGTAVTVWLPAVSGPGDRR